MVLGWFRRRRRRRYLAESVPADWVEHVAAQPFTAGLTDEEVQTLVGLARGFEDQVRFEGCAGFEINQLVVRSISLQACRMILGLGLEAYRKVRTVLVYPSSFIAETERGEVHASGLAVPDGPVLFAWDHVARGAANARDGRNVVYHEFAHKLDMLDGYVDGIPAVASPAQFRDWKRIVSVGHRKLRRAARRGRSTLIDAYGATSEAEFFAEASEVFFECPKALRSKHRTLYRAMCRFYRQHPARTAR